MIVQHGDIWKLIQDCANILRRHKLFWSLWRYPWDRVPVKVWSSPRKQIYLINVERHAQEHRAIIPVYRRPQTRCRLSLQFSNLTGSERWRHYSEGKCVKLNGKSFFSRLDSVKKELIFQSLVPVLNNHFRFFPETINRPKKRLMRIQALYVVNWSFYHLNRTVIYYCAHFQNEQS